MTKYFVKAVYARSWPDGGLTYTSLCTESCYAVQYEPGIWAEPVLPHSKLFLFQNIADTFVFLNTLPSKYLPLVQLPFTGIMLWWVEAQNVHMPDYPPLRALPDSLMERFWSEYPDIYAHIPWVYNPDEASKVALWANAVKLVHPVMPDEITRLLPAVD